MNITKIIFTLFCLMAMTFITSTSCSATKHDGGVLDYIQYRVTGGMSPYDREMWELKYDDDGKAILNIKGSSPGEVITKEVDPIVFEKVTEIAMRHKLYNARGFYKPTMIIHDAPSVSFYMRFDKKTSYSASGDIPKSIMDGIKEIGKYLRDEVLGDTKAYGHLEKLDGIPENSQWDDGHPDSPLYTYDGKGIDGIYENLANQYGLSNPQWHYTVYENNDKSAQYLVVEDYNSGFINALTRVDGKYAPNNPNIAGKLTEIMAGEYVNSKGDKYIITKDRMITISRNNRDIVSGFAFYEKDDMIYNAISMGSKYWMFNLTDKGINLYKNSWWDDKIKDFTNDGVKEELTLVKPASKDFGGRWPWVSERVINKGWLKLFPKRIMGYMSADMSARQGYKFNTIGMEKLREFFDALPWYKPTKEAFELIFNDTERLNKRLLESEIKYRSAEDDKPFCYE